MMEDTYVFQNIPSAQTSHVKMKKATHPLKKVLKLNKNFWSAQLYTQWSKEMENGRDKLLRNIFNN